PQTLPCPYCEVPQPIDPAESARGIDCTSCGTGASLGAWLLPSTSPHYLAISETTTDAFTQNIHSHSVAYTIAPNGEGVASGTVVQIGDRLLIATTEHTIPDDLKLLGFVAKDRIVYGDRSRWVRRAGKDRFNDIGFIELETAAIVDLGLNPISVERIVDAGPGDPRLKSRVIGFPWEMRQDHFVAKGVRTFKPLSYGCETVHLAAWPSLSFATKDKDPSIHVLAFYEREDNIDWQVDYVQSSATPDPRGMSGGGYWQRPRFLADSEVWLPDQLCLFAIQSAWFEKKSFLKGTQIIHWLKLVADSYPDELHSELHRRFPRLDTL
ncbi:MAG: hypothetical protein ACJ8LM_04865, partial [Candidatus Udaeobacter sp.]